MSDFPNGYLTTGNKPVITDVYKEAEEYLKELKRQDNLYNDEGDIYESAVIYAFMAGAKWQREQLEKERLRHCDERTAVKAAEVWHDENDVPKYNQNGVTDFIVSSAYGHIEGEAHTYTPKQWSAHLGFNSHREFRWAYESDLIDFD